MSGRRQTRTAMGTWLVNSSRLGLCFNGLTRGGLPRFASARMATVIASPTACPLTRIAAFLFPFLFLTACGTAPKLPITVKQAVATPCATDLPERPTFAADTLTGDEDIFTTGAALWADRKARQAYELKLEIRLAGCIKPAP